MIWRKDLPLTSQVLLKTSFKGVFIRKLSTFAFYLKGSFPTLNFLL